MNSREELLSVLKDMPEEAFGYVLIALKLVVEQNEANHGFTRDSTKSFVELAKSINSVTGEEYIDMNIIRQHNPRLFESEGDPPEGSAEDIEMHPWKKNL